MHFFDNQTNMTVGKIIWGVFWGMSTKFSSYLPQSKTFINIGYISFSEQAQQLFLAYFLIFVSRFIFMGKCVCVPCKLQGFFDLNEHVTVIKNHLFKGA